MRKRFVFSACLASLLIGCESATLDSVTVSDNSSSSVNGIDTEVNTQGNISTDSEGSNGETGGNSNTDSAGLDNNTGLDGVVSATTANGLVNSVGLIKLEPIGVTVDSTRGLFGDLPATLTEREVRDWYIPPADQCMVTSLTNDTMTPDGFLVLDLVASQVSAGDSIVLTDENGTYATLQRMDNATGPIYLPEAEIEQPAGMNLNIDIPGGDFRAFPNIAVPQVPDLQIDRPTVGENVGVATFFQWQANNIPGSTIELYTGGFSSVSNEEIFIACALVDDGSFTFPEELQQQMGADFIDDFTTILRVGYNVAADGDSMVFVANSVQTNL